MISVIIPSWKPFKPLTDKYVDWLQSHIGKAEVIIPEGAPYSVLEGMANGAKMAGGDLLMFLHDDVEIYQKGWDLEIENHFKDHPKCGLAGFGGALGLGDPELYKVPYKLSQLARSLFMSNMREAEQHGSRSTVPTRVAVLDGFCQIFTSESYQEMGGWEAAIADGLPPHHMYDAWAACRMAELGREVWMLPIACHHRGGETACSHDYQEWLKTRGYADDAEVHRLAHKVLYDRFRKILPLRV